MKLAIVGDSHCIDPHGPEPEKAQDRHHFRDTQVYQQQLCALIRDEAPDLMISTGDMVDWCSPANIAYAHHLFSSMGVPWLMTPGNHDYSGADHQPRADAPDLWQAQGVELHNRVIDADGLRVVLVDSHDSGVPEGTGAWLDSLAATPGPMISITHVPWNTPPLRDLILHRQPKRDLRKYIQSRAPDLYQPHVRGRFAACFFGHLHFQGHTQVDGTAMHILPLSICASDREYPEQGRIVLLDTATLDLRWRALGQ
ncbi:MAG: hypothetical protein EA401_14565 [Planctomycetota bacterium]|nr:MAG: hypothetical protein EA401_14565 [Planctomycetota bacterium]